MASATQVLVRRRIDYLPRGRSIVEDLKGVTMASATQVLVRIKSDYLPRGRSIFTRNTRQPSRPLIQGPMRGGNAEASRDPPCPMTHNTPQRGGQLIRGNSTHDVKLRQQLQTGKPTKKPRQLACPRLPTTDTTDVSSQINWSTQRGVFVGNGLHRRLRRA